MASNQRLPSAKPTARPVQRTPEQKPTVSGVPAKHRLPGTKPSLSPASKKASTETTLDDLLSTVNQNATEKPKKKGEKPVITLEGKASDLLELQQSQAEQHTLVGRIKQLEGELFEEIEPRRVAINVAKQDYIGSLYVQATGNDEDGDPINAGQVLYYVQHRYSSFNPRNLSKNASLQERYENKATLRDEAIEAVMEKLGIDRLTAKSLLMERLEEENAISIQEGALKNPEVLKILQTHLAKYLVSDTQAKPSTGFSERSNYNELDRKIMEALNEVGLCKRAKAVIKASGAPEQD